MGYSRGGDPRTCDVGVGGGGGGGPGGHYDVVAGNNSVPGKRNGSGSGSCRIRRSTARPRPRPRPAAAAAAAVRTARAARAAAAWIYMYCSVKKMSDRIGSDGRFLAWRRGDVTCGGCVQRVCVRMWGGRE